MALTFDDGPFTYTSQILDILDKLQVKATFFITGNNKGNGHIDQGWTGYRDVLRRMYNTGHQIASHTWTHRDLNSLVQFDGSTSVELGLRVRKSEMIFNEMAFRNIFGWIPTYMRAPYLECAESCQEFMGQLGYHIISTNMDTKDYLSNDPSLIEQARQRFSDGVSTNAAQSSYISLAHDIHLQTVINLTPFMVELSRSRGYKLVTVGECLGDPETNWYRFVDGASRAEGDSGRRAPSPPSKPRNTQVVGSGQRCGPSTGKTCLGSGFGDCCSEFGYWYVPPPYPAPTMFASY
ncbi:chitin deacetylase [Drechmeria coniospora]|uniref:Chitin deacetylase n=1 Tax=Drechmeria coniospora TaxID=98403 RepID=A0A151GHB9_DRECN|nr:chitin deacetylase [Drechmeria coniospora]KYK56432.1 chitin deacetylase [Drechmeria coniospora]